MNWKEKILAWSTGVILIALLLAGIRRVDSINAEEAKAHMGHGSLHTGFERELMTVHLGDLVSSGEQVYVVVGPEPETQNDRVNMYSPNAYTSGEAIRISVIELARRHFRVVRRGSPEYERALGEFFNRLTERH